MRQSELFTKTRKEAPRGEVSQNAKLLIKAGFIHKEMAGVYSYLPLGLRVFEKIVAVIRDEMNKIGGQEVCLTSLQDPEVWKKTGRWSDDVVDVWFKTVLSGGTELGLANTHEEPLTNIMRDHIHSYRDLPAYVYQFQTKFRNELRAKSGLMRTREFVMKDLYSFSKSIEEHEAFYKTCGEAYVRVFARAGIGDITFQTFASGGSFSKFSHEFQTLSSAGEDTIYLSRKRSLAVNEEVYTDEVLKEIGLEKSELTQEKSIEVGNIFSLGTRFSEAIGLTFRDEAGEERPVVMGSYGIGPGRLMGTIAETQSDQGGLVWPREVAPFQYHLITLPGEGNKAGEKAEALYRKMETQGLEVLFDDRGISAGEKFADADLIGIPSRLVISDKTVDAGKIELTDRKSGESRMVAEEELFS